MDAVDTAAWSLSSLPPRMAKRVDSRLQHSSRTWEMTGTGGEEARVIRTTHPTGGVIGVREVGVARESQKGE